MPIWPLGTGKSPRSSRASPSFTSSWLWLSKVSLISQPGVRDSSDVASTFYGVHTGVCSLEGLGTRLEPAVTPRPTSTKMVSPPHLLFEDLHRRHKESWLLRQNPTDATIVVHLALSLPFRKF